MPRIPAPKRRGRPPLTPAERKPDAERHRNTTVSLSPAAYQHAERIGDGSASRGLRLIAEAAARNAGG